MPKAIARISKLKGGSVASAGSHSQRTRETPNADKEKREENRLLIGDERPLREVVNEVIAHHGGKPRSDSVECVEMLLTASPEYFTGEGEVIDQEKVNQFCARAVEFLRDKQTGGLCVKAVLHLDESTPHVHAYKVPLDENGKLNCKRYFGGRAKLRAFQDAYAAHMQPLGLERGQRGSRATHTEIKQFYGAIKEEPKLQINYELLPGPTKLIVFSEEKRQEYKEELATAVFEQLFEPLRTLQHQAMLTRDEKRKREEAQKRADQLRAQMERMRSEKQGLLEEKARLESSLLAERQHGQELSGKVESLSRRVEDIPLVEVMERLGYSGAQQRDGIAYRSDEGQIVLSISDERLYDEEQQEICSTSIDLVLYMKNEQEEVSMTPGEAISWLADHFGERRATAAYIVEREQTVTEALSARRQERQEQERHGHEPSLEQQQPETVIQNPQGMEEYGFEL